MSKKGSSFFEEHIEKVILGVIGVVCLWLLVTRVVISPNFVEYDNTRFSAGRIDDYIGRQADSLEDKINREPESAEQYKTRSGDFLARFNSILESIDGRAYLPQPSFADTRRASNRIYTIPQVGEIKNVEAEHIRAVAFIPTQIVNEENTYQQIEKEPNDLDVVTVEAKFNVAGLYGRFYANFAGENVRNEQWRDPCLAVPVFAATQLQRQELLADGIWSDWQIVPRTRIDERKKIFELVDDVRKLPAGGVKIRLLQFNDPILKKNLLQPDGYSIASVGDEWFPPLLYKEFVKIQQTLKAQSKHDSKLAGREERSVSRPGRRKGTETRTRGTKSGDEDITGGTGIISSDTSKKAGAKKTRVERASEKETADKGKEVKTTADIYNKFNAVLISPATDMGRMSEPLTFWAIDDMVTPGKTYRYRIRLGVFNPIAGTNEFREEDKHISNDVVLWSDFSEVTKDIEIPAMQYFFPRDMQEVSGTVVVQVSKYVLGNWYSKDFMVKRGEAIGKTGRTEITEENPGVVIPEIIDYDTGAIVVDIVSVNDWSGGKGLSSRSYFDMLYSFDGTKVEHMPIKNKNWDEKFQAKFLEIKKAEKEPKTALHGWDSTGIKGGTGQQIQSSTKITSEGD